MLKDLQLDYYPRLPPDYAHQIKASIVIDGKSYDGSVELFIAGVMRYVYGAMISDGVLSISHLSPIYEEQPFFLLVYAEGKPFFSTEVMPDNVVVYNIAISTQGGAAPAGDPATISGKVERVFDNQAIPAARQLVAVEHRPDGSWKISGAVVSDAESGAYTLEVLTEGGATYVLALDDYGLPFTANAEVKQGAVIHPSIANGFIYRVEVGGTLPDIEPLWWIDTGTTHTKTLQGGVTLRAMAFYRPLAHGPVIPALLL